MMAITLPSPKRLQEPPMAVEIWLAFAAAAADDAILAQSARHLIKTPTLQRTINRTGSTLLIGAGVLTATLRRATP